MRLAVGSMTSGAVLAALAACSDDDVAGIYEENASAHRLGINGVPSYLFNGHMVISGAQGITAKIMIAVITASIGARVYTNLSTRAGVGSSLKNSFTASAAGCMMPPNSFLSFLPRLGKGI